MSTGTTNYCLLCEISAKEIEHLKDELAAYHKKDVEQRGKIAYLEGQIAQLLLQNPTNEE